jgi:hypothetical protein
MEKTRKTHNFLLAFIYLTRKYNDIIRRKPNNGSVIMPKE